MIPSEVHKTIDSFATDLRKDKSILGLFLVGSYATGQYTNTSDIDLKIILDSFTQKKYKGVKVINGYHVSYIAYSIIEAYDIFYSQLRTYSKFQARMLSQGKILYDPTDEMKHLQNEAQLVMQLPFVKLPIATLQLEAYNLWKYKDALCRDILDRYTLKEYHVFLEKALILYAKLLEIECIFQYPFFKMDQYISDANFRAIYEISEFPDKVFLNTYNEGVTSISTAKIQQVVTILFERIEEALQLNFEAFEIAS